MTVRARCGRSTTTPSLASAAGAGLSSMADRYLCRDCSKPVTATTRGRYRTHADGNGDPCVEGSGREIPEDLIMAGPESGSPEVPKEGIDFGTCPQCDRKDRKSTRQNS